MSSFSEKFKQSNHIRPTPRHTHVNSIEKFTNPSSSVNMGISEEGGLRDLSFKSIEYTKYVENVELVRDVLFDDTGFKPSIVNDNIFDGNKYIDTYKQEIRNIKQNSSIVQNINAQNDLLSGTNDKLSDLIKDKQQISDLGSKLLAEYKEERKGYDIAVNRAKYEISSVKYSTQQILDVENLDETAYIKADISSISTNTGSGLASFNDGTGSVSTSSITETAPSFDVYTQDIEMS